MRDGAKTTLARQLRRTETLAEGRLWQNLRDRRLDGLKFVRQATVGPYVADFLCREHKLIVEVDGATHASDDDIRSDGRRTAHLGRLGYKVIRLQNIEVFEAMDMALSVIREALHHLPSPAPHGAERPLPRAGEDDDGVHP
jgi:very-short-patch-repair endonuclease